MKGLPQPLAGVFFDLDGTLLDSAPDLFAALAAQCAEEGAPEPAYARVREVVSRGARAVLRRGFPEADEAGIEARVPRFLDLYAGVMAHHARLFDGVGLLLEQLEQREIRWGIVTNKAGFLAEPLLHQLGLHARAASVVAGDTLAVKKPDPAPVLHACAEAGVAPQHCVFVGDDARDVEAGRSAGLYTVAVSWGYLNGGDPAQWGADAVVDTAEALARLLDGRMLPA